MSNMIVTKTRAAAGSVQEHSGPAVVVHKAGAIEIHGANAMAARRMSDVCAGQIRVAVRYAGVGFADALAVAGNYPLAPHRPFVPGYEFFGTVLRVGTGVAGLDVGDRVCGMLTRMGAYRGILDVPASLAAKVPRNVTDEDAAALPLNFMTAMALLVRSAGLRPGQSFLIHGAAGGVGTATLQIASVLGLHAFGTASPEKHDMVRSLGGVPINYREGDWLSRALVLQPEGFDAVFDSFGGTVLHDSWRAVRRGGTLVSYGFYSSTDDRMPRTVSGLLFLLSRNLLSIGRHARICGTPAIIRSDPRWFQDTMTRLLHWVAAHQIRPVIDRILPWYDVAQAHQAIRDSRVQGKVLLDFGSHTIHQ